MTINKYIFVFLSILALNASAKDFIYKQWGAYDNNGKIFAYTKNYKDIVFAIAIDEQSCGDEEIRLVIPKPTNANTITNLKFVVGNNSYTAKLVNPDSRKTAIYFIVQVGTGGADFFRKISKGSNLKVYLKTDNGGSGQINFKLTGSAAAIARAYSWCPESSTPIKTRTQPKVKKKMTSEQKSWLKKAQAGEAWAQYNLGLMYERGMGVEKNYQQAVKWYRKAAVQNHAAGQNNLGVMYINGYGVSKDYQQAVNWYHKAAEQGYAIGQSNLGGMYESGKGITKNYILAYAWYNLASSNGYESSGEYRDELERKMTAEQIALAQVINPLDNKQGNTSKEKVVSTGTGFFINTNYVLTNNHVTDDCESISLRNKEFSTKAKVIAYDKSNDLSLLRSVEQNNNTIRIKYNTTSRIGNEVIALGYPISSILGKNIKATIGSITSLSGLKGDSNTMQISAPVQPGNSGGPLLDSNGNMIGVIFARVEKTHNNRPVQNLNLAIKKSVAINFLNANNIKYKVHNGTSTTSQNTADIIENAEKSVMLVTCRGK